MRYSVTRVPVVIKVGGQSNGYVKGGGECQTIGLGYSCRIELLVSDM